MEIIEVKATEKIQECWDLLLAHRDELATHKDLMVLKPDIAKYKVLEDKGLLLTLVLLKEKEIVGYSVTIFSHALHYADLKVAQNDIIFIRSDLRKGRWGITLIKETERKAKERGAQFMTFHGKEHTAFSDLMPKLGYGVQDIIFSRVL